MAIAAEDQVLVHLVADGVDVVLLQQPGDQRQLLPGKDLAGRIHGGIENERLGAITECRTQRLFIKAPVRRSQWDKNRRAADGTQHRHVGIVSRLQHNDLVSLFYHCIQAYGQGLRSARADDDFTAPVCFQSVEALLVPRHRLAQFLDAAALRILVGAFKDGLGSDPAHGLRAVGVGKTLAQVDGPVFVGQVRHDGKDGHRQVGKGGIQWFGHNAYSVDSAAGILI